MKKAHIIIVLLLGLYSVIAAQSSTLTYPIVDTGQKLFYDNTGSITEPGEGEAFFGQDAHYDGFQPSYTDNGDGTITDNVTGLIWQQNLLETKFTYEEAVAAADTFSLAGYNDWRLPTIKELYSLILFDGVNGMSAEESIPYLDTDYFEFRYGDEYDPSERFIDAQYATTTVYVSTTMNNEPTMFGVNFADGRIKGYPQSKNFEAKFVRGSSNYGVNDLKDNGNGTITDAATGLMWDKNGSNEGMNWEEALAWVEEKNSDNYLGYTDWRLPNAKELQSLLDYTKSPATNGKPAIDDMFFVPEITDEGGGTDFPFYWTGTTHYDGPQPNKAAYIAFGTALGFMEIPPGSGNYTLMDVHGAGAQRSDPKDGDPANYPNGFGPQGDVIRIYNYVRPVRDAETSTGVEWDNDGSIPDKFSLEQNYPNPFNPETTITFSIPEPAEVSLKVYDIIGNEIAILQDGYLDAGSYAANFDAADLSSGIYVYNLTCDGFSSTKKMALLK